LVAVAANNAAWIISNGVCDVQDLEKALKLGMGIKVELFKTLEKFGVENVVRTLMNLREKYGSFYEPERYLLSYNSR
jgi:enoyl-CoA hydratase/3-hydroxyacyl-CoA dehydrogenase